MVKLKKAKSSSLVENVVRQVEGAILGGGLSPGDKLPSTRKMQAILGASLGTIREAMAILESKGLIYVKKGAKGGYFIRELSTESASESLDLMMRHLNVDPNELAEFRMSAEAGLIRLVVERASDEDVQHLVDYLEELEDCLDVGPDGWQRILGIERRIRADMLDMADNRIYRAVLEPIHNNIISFAEKYLVEGDEEAMTLLTYKCWKDIFDALAARDADAAAALTEKMISSFLPTLIQRAKEQNGLTGPI